MASTQPSRHLDHTGTTATPHSDYRDTAASCRIFLLPERYIGRNSQRQTRETASFSFPTSLRLIYVNRATEVWPILFGD